MRFAILGNCWLSRKLAADPDDLRARELIVANRGPRCNMLRNCVLPKELQGLRLQILAPGSAILQILAPGQIVQAGWQGSRGSMCLARQLSDLILQNRPLKNCSPYNHSCKIDRFWSAAGWLAGIPHFASPPLPYAAAMGEERPFLPCPRLAPLHSGTLLVTP